MLLPSCSGHPIPFSGPVFAGYTWLFLYLRIGYSGMPSTLTPGSVFRGPIWNARMEPPDRKAELPP